MRRPSRDVREIAKCRYIATFDHDLTINITFVLLYTQPSLTVYELYTENGKNS